MLYSRFGCSTGAGSCSKHGSTLPSRVPLDGARMQAAQPLPRPQPITNTPRQHKCSLPPSSVVQCSASRERSSSSRRGVQLSVQVAAAAAGGEGKRRKPKFGEINHMADQLQPGPSDTRAADQISRLDGKRASSDLNVREWVQLLQSYGVEQPAAVVSRNPFILKNVASNYAWNAAAAVLWMSSKGLTSAQISQVVGKKPMMFVVPVATMEGADACLRCELGWGGREILTVLARSPFLFVMNPAENLLPKLLWFKSKGISRERVSKMLFYSTIILTCSIEHYEAQLSALQAYGLSHSDVLEMVKKAPTLFCRDLDNETALDKIRFLTQVMGRSTQALVVSPKLLLYDLFRRTGPRFSFFSTYCPGQEFVLSTRMDLADPAFAERLRSPNLDAARELQGMTNLQLYLDHRSKWQLAEGACWLKEQPKKGRKPKATKVPL